MTANTITNLTPHQINVLDASGITHIFNSLGVVRTAPTTSEKGELNAQDVCFSFVVSRPATELDEPSRELIRSLVQTDERRISIIVSSLAAPVAAREFPEVMVFSPGALRRNAAGQPIGCDGLQFWPGPPKDPGTGYYVDPGAVWTDGEYVRYAGGLKCPWCEMGI